MIENTFKITNEQYSSGAVLDEYNGSYSICSAQKAENGKLYLRWVYPQTKEKSPSSKIIPAKVTLGDKQQAIKLLKSFLVALDETIQPQSEEQNGFGEGVPKTDIPF